jgi:hypothetical protein
MIQNLFYIMTGIAPEMAGNQHSCCSLPTISFASSLLKQLGCFRCKIAKRGDVLNKQEARGTGAFSTGIYKALHPLLTFEFVLIFQITRQLSSQIYWRYCIIQNTQQLIDNGTPFDCFL